MEQLFIVDNAVYSAINIYKTIKTEGKSTANGGAYYNITVYNYCNATDCSSSRI